MADLADRLLGFLREHLDDPQIDVADPLRPLTGSAFTEVFEFALAGPPDPWAGRPLVLRLYGPGTDRLQPALEHAIQEGAANAGFPSPRVLVSDGDPDRLGHGFMVMERLPGRGFLRGIKPTQFARDFPRLIASWPETFASVAVRLHTLDPSPAVEAARTLDLDSDALSTSRHLRLVEQQFERLGDERHADGLAWLRAHEPTAPTIPSIVHGDLWPANVLMQRGELTGVVDWERAGIGDPALDVGFAKAGLALMPAPFPPPAPIRQAVNRAGQSIARRVHEAYDKARPIDPERVRYYEALRCLMELAPVVEYRAGSRSGPRPPWHNGFAALTGHFEAVTGVPVG